MASLRDVVSGENNRVVYGVDLLRGTARVDEGTGGGSPSAADNAPVFDAYAQTAAYVQSQWFARSGNQVYAGLRAERDGGIGGAYSPSLGGILHLQGGLELRLNAATAFRADGRRTLLSELLESESRAGANARRRRDAGRAESLGRREPDLVHDQRIELHRLASALLRTGKRREGVHCGADVLGADAGSARLLRRARRDEPLPRADLETQTRLPGRGPVFATTLALRYLAPAAERFDGFVISAHTQGAQEAPDPYLSPAYAAYQPASFTDVDGYAGYRLTPHLLVALRGYNLGNDRYAIFAGFPMPGRSFALELRAK